MEQRIVFTPARRIVFGDTALWGGVAAGALASAQAAAASAVSADTSADSADASEAAIAALLGSVAFPPNAMVPAATRAALALLDTAFPAFLTEQGREGVFFFRAGDQSARVTADTRQGLYVAPAATPSGAAGAWVRKFDGSVSVRWFGATGDGVTDDSAAFVGALAILKVLRTNHDLAYWYGGSYRLYAPAGHYYLAGQTLDITNGTIIEGDNTFNGYGTRLRWGENATGIRVQGYNTAGTGSVAPGQDNAGASTAIRNLLLTGPVTGSEGGLAGGEAEYHGIHVRAGMTIEDVRIEGFRGDGIHVNTTSGGGGADEGNSNCSFINRVFVTTCRNGLFLDGADANAWTIIGLIATYSRQHAVWDSSFLGNTHIGHHSANSGLVPGVPPCVVTYMGNRYFVRMGQAAGAATNAPSGTTADNTWWYYLSAGGVATYLNIDTWVSGTTVREGGGYKADSLNGYNTFIGLYQEGGEATSQFISPSEVIGGLGDPKTTGNQYNGHRLYAPNDVRLGQTVITCLSGAASFAGAVPIQRLHNNAGLAVFTMVRQDLAQGYLADGVTPLVLGGAFAYSSTANPATAEGNVGVATRSAGGALIERYIWDTPNACLRPMDHNVYDIGVVGLTWRDLVIQRQIKIAGTKVLGTQGAALPGDAADLATAIALANAIKARMVAHGLVAA